MAIDTGGLHGWALALGLVAAIVGCHGEVDVSPDAGGGAGVGGAGATGATSGGDSGGDLIDFGDAGEAGLPSCAMTGCPAPEVCCPCYGSPVPDPGGSGPTCGSHCVAPCTPNVDGCQSDGCGPAPK